jgi:hypothetical protein
LFYQELMNIKKANKIFIAWENLKHVILMHILNIIIKQIIIIIIKIQNTFSNYIKMLKMRLNSIIKVVFK